VAKRNREFFVCFNVSKRIRMCVCGSTGFYTKVIREHFDNLTDHTMILSVNIVRIDIDPHPVTD